MGGVSPPMIIWMSLAVIIVIWLFRFRKSLINQRRLKALHEYERELLNQNENVKKLLSSIPPRTIK